MPDDYWLLLVLALLICGSAAGAVAYNKGRSYPGWFILGLIFGPFAVLGIAVASPVNSTLFDSDTLPDQISKLAHLHEHGVLTDTEYEAAKARLLS